MDLEYASDRAITVDDFIDLLRRSTLGERRPLDDRACMQGMLAGTSLLVTAWAGGRLVGLARCLTDFHFACYLADLAVDQACQRLGVGRELQRRVQERLGPRCSIILLAAPKAVDYYPRVGYSRHESCWILKRDERIAD